MRVALEDLAVDPETEVLVITGAGKAFCAGQDIKLYFRGTADDPAARHKARNASNAWRWIPYANSNGSVSGGTRWGGGIWSNSEDLARFGLLILNHGRWKDRQLVSERWLKDATQASAHGPDYGYLWWLNTKGKQWPSAPKSSFAAIGNGSNIIWIDPEHDLVVVWRWHGPFMDGVIQRTLAAILDK